MYLGCYVINTLPVLLWQVPWYSYFATGLQTSTLDSFAALCIDMWQHQIAVKQADVSVAHKQQSWPIHWQNCDLIDTAALFQQPDTLANACNCVTRQHFKMLSECRLDQNMAHRCTTAQCLTPSEVKQSNVVPVHIAMYMRNEWAVPPNLIFGSGWRVHLHVPAVLPPRKSPGNHWGGVCLYRKAIWRYFLFSVALRPNAGHGLLILEVSRSHTTTHHSQ